MKNLREEKIYTKIGFILSDLIIYAHTHKSTDLKKWQDQLLSLFEEFGREIIGEMQKENEHDSHYVDGSYCVTCDRSIDNSYDESKPYRNILRQEQLKKLKELLGKSS